MNDKLLANPKLGNMNGWQDRHNDAVRSAVIFDGPCAFLKPEVRYKREMERSIVVMLEGWLRYAEAHKAQYESTIGEDSVLGPEWESIGQALIGLLNGETGRLDCGTLDGAIRDALVNNGCEDE